MDVYDPQGHLMHCYSVPVRQPTCPAWISNSIDGPLNGVVTTSASTGLDARTAAAADGKTIALHVPVVGRAEPLVKP